MEFDFTVETYYKMLEKYSQNQITAGEWILYCQSYLFELMSLHSDILENLKNIS